MVQTLDDRIVDIEQENKDRRESYRMAGFGGDIRTAKLKVGSKMVEVDILDESAGGFLIAAKRFPKIKKNKNEVELFTSGGAHLLRVAWQRKVDGHERLGLQRLCKAPSRQESPWGVFLVAAVVIGLGAGLVASKKGNLFGGGQVIVNDTIPADTTDAATEITK